MITKFGSCSLNQDGYFIISSRKEGNFGKYLHRLIYEEHYGKIPKNIIIHHIDGNKQNNKASNLEWVTQSDNNKHYYQHCEQQHGGKKQPISVSFSDGTMQIYNSICDCARALKMTDKRICHILRYYNGIDPLSDKIFKRMSND